MFQISARSGKKFFKRRISSYLLTRIYRSQIAYNTADRIMREIAWDAFKRKPSLTDERETVCHSGSFSFEYFPDTTFPVEYSVSINFQEEDGTSAENANVYFNQSHVLCVDELLRNTKCFDFDYLKQMVAVALKEELRKPTESLPSDIPSMPKEVLDNAELVRGDDDGTLKKTLQKAITFLGNPSVFSLTEQDISELVNVAYERKELKEKFYIIDDYGTVSKVALDILFNNSKFMELGEVANLLDKLYFCRRAANEYLSCFQKDTINYKSFHEWLSSSVNYLAENMSFSIEEVCDRIFNKWEMWKYQTFEPFTVPFETSTPNLFIDGYNPCLTNEGEGNGQ